MPATMSSKVFGLYRHCHLYQYLSTEFVQSEVRFTEVKDALKPFNKMDFDKLIASVSTSTGGVSSSDECCLPSLRSQKTLIIPVQK